MLALPWLWYWPGLLASLINRNWSEARQEIQARLYWGPCCRTGEREQTTSSLARSLRGGWRACSLHGVRVGMWPGVGARCGLGGLPTPLVVVCAGGHAQYPAFALGSSIVAVGGGFLVFLYLLSIICPNCACTQLFLVLCSFFVFCCWRTGVSRCKHCSTAAKGPRSQPVSVGDWGRRDPGPSLSQLETEEEGKAHSMGKLLSIPWAGGVQVLGDGPMAIKGSQHFSCRMTTITLTFA